MCAALETALGGGCVRHWRLRWAVDVCGTGDCAGRWMCAALETPWGGGCVRPGDCTGRWMCEALETALVGGSVRNC
jgi:hypothetical protein